jgi:hypothetical protein
MGGVTGGASPGRRGGQASRARALFALKLNVAKPNAEVFKNKDDERKNARRDSPSS